MKNKTSGLKISYKSKALFHNHGCVKLLFVVANVPESVVPGSSVEQVGPSRRNVKVNINCVLCIAETMVLSGREINSRQENIR